MPSCPRCHAPLTDAELRSLWAARNAARRKTIGRKGGRPHGSKDSKPRKRNCICGHDRYRHNEHEDTHCMESACDCVRFRATRKERE